MSGTYTSTGTYANLTRLELEQLRRGDYIADGKALTIGDSGLPPEGVVGKGSVNSEVFYSNAALTLESVNSVTPPTRPGVALGKFAYVYPNTAGLTWYGPTAISTLADPGSLRTTSTTGTSLTDLGATFVTDGVLPGDLILIESDSGSGLPVGVVATVNSETSITATNITSGTWPVFSPRFYQIVRPSAVQLFAVPGSGPVGQEQTYLFVTPGSGVHNEQGLPINTVNAARIRDIISPRYALNSTVDRADAPYVSPAPHSPLGSLGYRVVLYPSNGSGTGPDLTQPITSLNPIIDPSIPAGDQRMTIDYTAGTVRFSCAPAIGGQIKVAGGVQAATGRLNLYAVFWADSRQSTKRTAESLYYHGLGGYGGVQWVPAASLKFVSGQWQFAGHQLVSGAYSSTAVNISGSVPLQSAELTRQGTPAPTLSLVERANAAVFTCGDGVTSWGDFSGSTAVIQAWSNWLASNPTVKSLTIHLKPGTYSLPFAINIPTGYELILRGGGREMTRLVANVGSSAVSTLNIDSGARLQLSDLSIVAGTGGHISSVGALSAERCRIEDVRVIYTNAVPLSSVATGSKPPLGLFRDCEISYESGSAQYLFEVSGNGVDQDGFYFYSCNLRSARGGRSFFHVTASGSGASACKVTNIVFDSCLIEIHSSSTSGSTTQYGGGVITVSPNLTTGILRVDRVRILNCTVQGLNTISGPVPQNTVLLHLMPLAFDASNLTYSAILDTVEVSGGTWTVPTARGTFYSPFFLNCHHPIVRDLTFRSGGVPGNSGSAPGYHGNGIYTNPQKLSLRGSLVIDTQGVSWCTIAASGSALQGPTVRNVSGMTVKNLTFTNFHRLAGATGVVTLYGPDIRGGPVDVDGVHIMHPIPGAATDATIGTWVHLVPGGVGNTDRGSNGTFRGITFNSAATSAVGSRWATAAFIGISAEGRLFLDSASLRPGLEGADPCGSFYAVRMFYPWDEAGMTTCPSGPITINNTRIANCTRGVFLDGTSPSSARTGAGPLTVSNSRITVAQGATNAFTRWVEVAGPSSKSVTITGNSFEATNLPDSSNPEGVKLIDSAWKPENPFDISNNTSLFGFVSGGNPGTTHAHIFIRSTGGDPQGQIRSNSTVNMSGTGYYEKGSIRVQRGASAAIVSPPLVQGVSTSASLTTFTNGLAMNFNNAFLVTP